MGRMALLEVPCFPPRLGGAAFPPSSFFRERRHPSPLRTSALIFSQVPKPGQDNPRNVQLPHDVFYDQGLVSVCDASWKLVPKSSQIDCRANLQWTTEPGTAVVSSTLTKESATQNAEGASPSIRTKKQAPAGDRTEFDRSPENQ